MARKGIRPHAPAREAQLRDQVSQILAAPQITPMMISNLLMMGARIYKDGMGLPQHAVWNAILAGFADHDRYYLTPEQQAALQGSDNPMFDHLNE